jgi:hypothetical protein
MRPILWLVLLLGAARAGADSLALSLDTPSTDALGWARVSGQVVVPGEAPLDLLLAVDTSHSTAACPAELRGWRRWLGWLLPRRPQPPGALEREIARGLDALASLDPAHARAGVVAFAGDHEPRTPDAWVAAPLGKLEDARRALHALLARGSRGATNRIEGLELARAELLGEIGAHSRARAGARRVLMVLTDGVGIHPLHPDPREALALLRSAEARVAEAGIELGPPPLRGSAELAEIRVLDARSGAPAGAAQLAGNRFEALVRLSPGPNRLEVRALTRSGARTRRALELIWDPSVPAAPRSPARLRAHNDLLARHLRALRARPVAARLEIEAEAAPH